MIQKPYSYLQDYTTGEHYILKGIIYYNENHFTARIIDKNLSIWYLVELSILLAKKKCC